MIYTKKLILHIKKQNCYTKIVYFIPYSKLNIKIDFLIYQNYETPFKYILEVTLSDIYKYRNICLCYKFNIFVIKNLNLDKQINDKKISEISKNTSIILKPRLLDSLISENRFLI